MAVKIMRISIKREQADSIDPRDHIALGFTGKLINFG